MKKFAALLMLITASTCTAKHQLTFAIDVIRHGDRTPVYALPNETYVWQLGYGELTAVGMQQEYQLGQMLRQRYVEQTHLLPEQYNSKILYVHANDINRTIMSAQSLLTGLYPPGTGPVVEDTQQPALPKQLQPIPVHTVNAKTDVIFNDYNSTCLKSVLKQYRATDSAVKARLSLLRPKLKQWQELFGTEIDYENNLIGIGDNLHVRQLKRVALPEGLNQESANTIMQAAEWAFVSKYSSPKVSKYAAYPMLEKIISYLKTATTTNTPLKYVLFSGHDNNLLALMGALEHPLKQQPRYASNLNISLFQDDNAAYSFEIHFNGKPVTLPGCDKVDCPLQRFISYVDKMKQEVAPLQQCQA